MSHVWWCRIVEYASSAEIQYVTTVLQNLELGYANKVTAQSLIKGITMDNQKENKHIRIEGNKTDEKKRYCRLEAGAQCLVEGIH